MTFSIFLRQNFLTIVGVYRVSADAIKNELNYKKSFWKLQFKRWGQRIQLLLAIEKCFIFIILWLRWRHNAKCPFGLCTVVVTNQQIVTFRLK